jgi:hypothetical protein
MARWPRSRSVQVLISLIASAIAAAIAFPTGEKYLVWYYSRDAGSIHDGQTGLSVLLGAVEISVVVLTGMFLFLLLIQQIKTGGLSKKQ